MGRVGAVAPWAVTGLAAVGVLALMIAVLATPAPAAPSVRALVAPSGPADAPSSAPTTVIEVGAPQNTTVYPLASLTQLDVLSVTDALPVDDDPFGALTGELAQPLTAAPIFADPSGEPIGYLPRDAVYGGTIVPAAVHDTHWVKVLLSGRQGLPPKGSAAQAVGWLRADDIELTRAEAFVEVHLEAHTIDIVSAAGRERVADDFAWGKTSTPTPLGRTFVMMTRVVPEFAYTMGHPVVYLGVQSPTLAGFDGAAVAVTAFHYYRERSGANSFGCIYLDGAATDRLAQLAAGTPVIIYP